MRSAIYEGTLRHGRPGHGFTYPIALPYLVLDELDDVVAHHPLWSVERSNAATFRRADHLGDPDVPLDVAVQDLVEASTGRRPDGPVALLGNVRTWGWLFNPISILTCGAPAEALVLEVTNTPWHERHTYVLDGGAGEHRFAKAMHVSPFLPMDLTYRLHMTEPGDELTVRLDALDGEAVVFGAALDLRRREVDRRELGRLLRRMTTHRVSARIYRQAAALGLKRTPFHPHPVREARR